MIDSFFRKKPYIDITNNIDSKDNEPISSPPESINSPIVTSSMQIENAWSAGVSVEDEDVHEQLNI